MWGARGGGLRPSWSVFGEWRRHQHTCLAGARYLALSRHALVAIHSGSRAGMHSSDENTSPSRIRSSGTRKFPPKIELKFDVK